MTIINSQFPSGDGGSTGLVLRNVDCDPTVYVGAVVYLTAGVAYNAIATGLSTSNVIGIVESKISSTKCVIRVSGTSSEIFIGLDETKEYFLSDTIAGGIQTNPVTAGGHILLRIGQPFSSTRLVVIKGNLIVRA